MIELSFWISWSALYLWYKLRIREDIPVLPDDWSLEYMRVMMDLGIRGRKELQFLGVRHKTLLLHYPIELAKHKHLFAALKEEKRIAVLDDLRKQKESILEEANRIELRNFNHSIEIRKVRQSVMDYYFNRDNHKL